MKNIIRYKNIILYRMIAGLKSEAKKVYLGYLWFLLEPALMTGVLYSAMSHLTGQKGFVAAFSILFAMIVWQWLESSVMLSASSIEAKFHIHQQVPLPKYIFPLVDVCTQSVRFAFAFGLILIVWLATGHRLGLALVWLPLVLLLQLVLIVALALIVSIATTLIGDLRILLQCTFRMLFFVSGIFFTSASVPTEMLNWFHANPAANLIEAYRAILLLGQAPDLALLGRVALVATLLGSLGVLLQAHYNKRLLKLTNV